ncbi:MAG TPA: sugar phosphate isomerase/epimerase [Pirellula sp.]|nr:sugar phosphate isomerase/epimerase [Pirellula sp.]
MLFDVKAKLPNDSRVTSEFWGMKSAGELLKYNAMKLSLSVRIAEGFLSKEIPILPLDEVVSVAAKAGYSAVCMRASQVGIQSPAETVQAAIAMVRREGLKFSMVTGDFDTVYNNDRGPNALRNIRPYLRLATELGAPLIRVAVKRVDDIAWVQRAADEAAEVGIRLVHQCHTLSLFETVESIVDTIQRIDRKNFGLVYEPANLELCGQDYGHETMQRLAPWIFNVYLQNQLMRSDGAVTLNTWCRGPVFFNLIPVHAAGGIDFPLVIDGLACIGYEGYITVHQSTTDGETPAQSAQRTADYLRALGSLQ